jgi:hypothetical protein
MASLRDGTKQTPHHVTLQYMCGKVLHGFKSFLSLCIVADQLQEHGGYQQKGKQGVVSNEIKWSKVKQTAPVTKQRLAQKLCSLAMHW